MDKNVVELSLFDRLAAWFEVNKQLALWGAVGIAIVGVIAGFFVWQKKEAEINAANTYTQVMQRLQEAEARAMQQGNLAGYSAAKSEASQSYLKIADEFSGTAAAERARLEAAGLLFAAGKFAEARAQFERFVQDHSNSEFMPQAMLGVAASLDAEGKTNEALRAYENVVARFPSSNVVPQANFALGRIYEAQGNLEQAWVMFEKAAASSARSSVGSEAGIRAEEIKDRLPPSALIDTNAFPAFPVPGFQRNNLQEVPTTPPPSTNQTP